MKKNEITAEWILEKLPTTTYADGNGSITISTDSISDSNWIDLALDSIGAYYESDVIDEEGEPYEPCSFEIYWIFKIEELKEDCPNLYIKWRKMDLINNSYKNKN